MIATLLTTAACALAGHDEMVIPTCTPGEWDHAVTRRQACTPRSRAYIPVAVKRTVLARYGLTEQTFHGKYDHRVPHFMRGTDTPANLWPYPGTQPFDKDRLETYAYHRICRRNTLRIRTAVRWFTGDWRSRWRYYDRKDWP